MALLQHGRDNQASDGLDRARLNGQVYTPMALARSIVAGRSWPDGLLDPACGDGVFLEAAVREAVSAGRPHDVGRIRGWDLDPDAIAAARVRLERVCAALGVPGPDATGGPRLRLGDALELEPERPLSLVVGNPPYLESKRMPDSLKARIRALCPRAGRGGFDLYAAFVERSAGWLGPAGSMALIVPNRILVTRSTGELRRWLLSRGQVRVQDLSDADVFGSSAAVYPVVLGLSPGEGYVVADSSGDTRFPVETILDGLGGIMPLPPPDPVLRGMLLRVLEPGRFDRLGDRLRVRWTVSFHRAGLRDEYVTSSRPDSEHAAPFLGGGRYAGNRELAPYSIRWGGAWIDHDEQRAKADRNGLPPRALFTSPKVVFAQNARRCRAALDTTGLVLKDTFPLIAPAPAAQPDDLPWVTLVLNSRLFHVLYEALFGGTRKGGRYLHFLGTYLHSVPLPAPPPQARALHDSLAANLDDDALLAAAEALVVKAYGLTSAEVQRLGDVVVPEP